MKHHPVGSGFLIKKGIVVGIALAVGALHFVVGPQYRGPWPDFVNGYLIDILLPGALYLVMGLVDHPRLGSAPVRMASVFLIGAIAETLQYFGIPILGRTFDPLDYLMFAIGIGAGVLLETLLEHGLGLRRPDRNR